MTDLTPEAVEAALDGATPGPWIVDPENVGKSFSWCWQLRTEYGGTPIYVECESRSHSGTKGNEETANLIAMAPDLAREYLRLKKVEEAAKAMASEYAAMVEVHRLPLDDLPPALAAFRAAVEEG